MTKQELASRIWSMADKMRTKIKASEYKDYILGVLFYKYLSDKQEAFMRSEGATNQDIVNMDESDMAHVRENLGYAIMYKDLFSTWKQKGIALDAKTVSEALDTFNRNIDENYASSLKGIFSTLQNGVSKMGDSSGTRDQAVRAMVDMIDKIPTIGTEGYDVIGYIYEFLIYKFSTAARDDGAFYTPHEVSRLISMCVSEACKNKEELAVYDPTAGSGSLLRTVGEEASQYIKPEKIKYFGQELITETYNLCRMNLIMKNVPSQNICVRNCDTWADDWPYFDEHTAYQPLRVDAVVSNPPYSLHYNPDEHIND